jgi:hypothetical protein
VVALPVKSPIKLVDYTLPVNMVDSDFTIKEFKEPSSIPVITPLCILSSPVI